MSKDKRILGKTFFFPAFIFTCGFLQQLLAGLPQFSLGLRGGFSFDVAVMEMIWADCPGLALENLTHVFGMSQEGKCQVEITVPILSKMEQRQEGPVLLHLHAWPG